MKKLEYIESIKRVSVSDLRLMAEEAISFIERNAEFFAPPWGGLFFDAPDGEFEWKQEEAGDWIPSMDDGSWVKNAYVMNIGRRADGTEWVELVSVDSDGNWDTGSFYEKKRKARLGAGELRSFQLEMATDHCLYNLLKMALYSLHVAETGKDPLGDTILPTKKNTPRKVHARGVAYEIADLCRSVYKTVAEEIIKQKKK